MRITLELDDSCLPFQGAEAMIDLAESVRNDIGLLYRMADTVRIVSPFGNYTEDRP